MAKLLFDNRENVIRRGYTYEDTAEKFRHIAKMENNYWFVVDEGDLFASFERKD